MDQLVNGFKTFNNSEALLHPDDRILIAVSGGVDSMVLTDLIHKLGYNLGVAHVNFQMREKGSDLDEQLVAETAAKLKVPFYVTRFDTVDYANEKGISTQMAARDLRYQWFSELKEKHGYQKIATAHHINDVLETMLLNLTKGTGIAGLHGILPKRDSTVRPLLFADKELIINYAKNTGLMWREDPSNESNHYQRNIIRNQVVPILRLINPSLEEATRNTSEIIRSVEKHYLKSIDIMRKHMLKVEGQHILIKKEDLKLIEAPILSDLIKGYGFNYAQCKSLLGEAVGQSGRLFQSASHTLNIDRDHVFITPRNLDLPEVVIPEVPVNSLIIEEKEWNFSQQKLKEYTIRNDSLLGAFDLGKLVFPLIVRKWQPGDRFYPLGMHHSKKLSDFLIDTKVPMNFKERVQVLVSEGNIVWVVGHRIDNRYKVTEETKYVLEIEINVQQSIRNIQ